jgi:hypothetical protein
MPQSIDRSAAEYCQTHRLRFVTPQLLERVQAALGGVGPFGEVRLIVQKGRVRFIEVLRSESLDLPAEPKGPGSRGDGNS